MILNKYVEGSKVIHFLNKDELHKKNVVKKKRKKFTNINLFTIKNLFVFIIFYKFD